MATVNALSVALFNAAAGGYAAEMTANPAGFANAVGPILEKDVSTDALFVDHLLGNLGVTSTSSVYAQAKAAVAALVTTKGRAGAATDAVDFLKAQEGTTNAYATIAADFAAKVNKAATFTAAHATERDITVLVSGVTGVDSDAAAIAAAAAAATAAAEAAAAAAATKAAADLAAANAAAEVAATAAAAALAAAEAEAAADLAAANAAANAAAAAAKTAADAAAAKAAADLQAANDQITALQNPAGTTSVLTTAANTVITVAGGNDSLTGTDLTLLSGDIIVDGSTSDNDTLTMNVTAAPATAPTIVANIENVVYNVTAFSAPTLTASNFTGTKSYTINNLQASGATDARIDAVNTGATVNAGTGVTGTLTVNNNAAATVSVNGGTAATVTVGTVTTGSATIVGGTDTTSASGIATTGRVTISGEALAGSTAATATAKTSAVTLSTTGTSTTPNVVALTGTSSADTATVAAKGVVTLDVDATSANTKLETVNLSGNGAAVTYTADANVFTTINMTGDQDVTLIGDEDFFDGKTVNDTTTSGTTKLRFDDTTASSSDLTKVSVDVVEQKGVLDGAATYSVKSGSVIDVTSAQTAVLTLSTAGTSSTTGVTTDSVTVNAKNAATVLITSDSSTAATETAFNTVNFSVATAATTLTAILGTDSATLNLSGNKQITLGTTTTANLVNASALTGALVATAAATTTDNIIGGSGNDVITTASGAVVTLDGGAGSNNVKVQGDMSSVDFTNFGTITLDAAVTSAKASQLNGKAYVVTASASTAFSFGTTAANFDTSTIDLSKLTNNNVSGYTVDVSNGLSTALFTSTTGVNVTGTTLADTISGTANADVISAGNGANVIDGNAGADNITTGTGADTIYGGDAADVITSSTGADTIYGGGDAATKEQVVSTYTEAAVATGDKVTMTVFGKTFEVAIDTAVTTNDTLDEVTSLLADAINADAVVGKLVTATYGAGAATTSTLTVVSKVDGNLVDFAAGNTGLTSSTDSATAGVAGSDSADVITAGTGADFIVSGKGVDTIDLGSADTDADTVVLYLTTDGGDVISNFEAGSTGTDVIQVAGSILVNGSPTSTLASITKTGTIGANDVFVEITSAADAGGADAASEIVTFLANLVLTNVASGDKVVLAVNDGSDTYLWHFTEDGTAGIQSGNLALIAKLVGTTDIANGDLAAIIA